MRPDLKPNATMAELLALIHARVFLRMCQDALHTARLAGDPFAILLWELCVGDALDRLWEAQQAAAEG